MKRFILKLLPFLTFIALIQFILPVLIDPFHVFNWTNFRDNGIDTNANYSKMKKLLKNPDKYKFNAFIFGSSRTGFINEEKFTRDKCENMSYSMGIPADHLLNLQTMLKHNMHLKKIFIGIDSMSHIVSLKQHIWDPTRCPYEFLADDNGNYTRHFLELYANPIYLPGALREMFTNYLYPQENDSNVHDYGYVNHFDWNGNDVKPTMGQLGYKTYAEGIATTLNDIREIKNLCDENNIELVIFTNPMHRITYIRSLEIGYLNFLKGLAEITDFYNFSSLNDITTNNENYLETSHYRAEVGDLIIDVIYNGKKFDGLYEQGFGVKVNRNNIDELIKLLEQQWQDYKRES